MIVQEGRRADNDGHTPTPNGNRSTFSMFRGSVKECKSHHTHLEHIKQNTARL